MAVYCVFWVSSTLQVTSAHLTFATKYFLSFMAGSNFLTPSTITQLYPLVQEKSSVRLVFAVVLSGQHKLGMFMPVT